MEVNQYYSMRQIETNGLVEKNVKDVNSSIFTKDSKVYFFEPMGKNGFDFTLLLMSDPFSFKGRIRSDKKARQKNLVTCRLQGFLFVIF